jgi:glycosyltransferase involved in cell wall biosynthesis
MRILIVSSYPPRHCGIGAYARDQVIRLRAEGHDVTVLSPPDGDGDVRAPFLGGGAFRRAARMGRGFDRIVVHFQPALYFPPGEALQKVLTSASLLWLVARRRRATELVIHESDPPLRWRPDYILLGVAFRVTRSLAFHTGAERLAFEREYRMRLGPRGRVIPHVAVTAIAIGSVSRREARERLGIGAARERSGPVLVAPGFIQPSKGFDRALEAFATVFGSDDEPADPGSATGASLYLVGSVREETPENRSYASALRTRCAEVAGAHLVERFVTEEEFDLWVVAADRVVLPYRRSWSSGVLARAHELGTPAIVCDVGGLAEQASAADVMVEGDEGLVEVFETLRAEAREGAGR